MKTRIVHVVPSIREEASGPSYSVTRLCEALNATGCNTELAVLAPVPQGCTRNFIQAFPSGMGPSRLGNSPAMKKWLLEQVSSGGVKIIHDHSLWMLPNLYPAQVVKRSSCKLLVSPRGTLAPAALSHSRWLKKIAWPFLAAPVLSRADAFHATSFQEADHVARFSQGKPMAIVPNGIDIPPLSRNTKSSEERTLLYLGRIHPHKNIATLLHAWSAVESGFPTWKLMIVGPSDNEKYFQEMQSLAQRLNLRRCHFSGPLYGREKRQAYERADLYVLPSRSENFGMTVAEALANGTPVIVTKGAPWEGVRRERCGWWIDMGVETLATTLKEALAKPPGELAEMGRRGRKWMQRNYSWDRIANDMINFYEWLLGKKEKPSFVLGKEK